jgi:hypothetical protein
MGFRVTISQLDETYYSLGYSIVGSWNNKLFETSVYGAQVSRDRISKYNLFNAQVDSGVYTYTVATDIANSNSGTFKVYVSAVYVDGAEAGVSPYAAPTNAVPPSAASLAGAAGYAGVVNNVFQFSGPAPETEYL